MADERWGAWSEELPGPAQRGGALALLDVLWDAPVGIALLDRELRVVRVNAAMARMTRHPAEEHAGVPAEELPPILARRREALAALEGAASQGVVSTEWPPGSRETACWLASYRPLRVGEDVAGLVAVFVDITARRRAERAAQDAKNEAELAVQALLRLQAVTASLAAALTPAEVARVVMEEGVGLLDACAGSLSWSTGPDDVEVLDAFGFPERSIVTRRRCVAQLPAPVAEAFRTGEAVWIESNDAFRARYGRVAPRMFRGACLAVPLVGRERVVGVLGVAFGAPRTFDAADRSFVLALADQAAQALERARLYEEQERLRAEAERTADRLRRAEEFRKHVLGIVGHDLRNPLSAISGFATLLAGSDRLDEARRRMVARIQASAGKAARIAGDLLDLTRVESSHGIPIDPREVRVEEVCAAVADEARSAFPGREIRCGGLGSPDVVWDPDRVSQALSNLLVNALKYGAEDRPVTLAWEGLEDEVALSVHNWGAPIPEAIRDHLFEPFRQGARAAARGGGLGLGLYISREIASAHGGTLDASSRDDVGTTFTLRLPRRAASGGSTVGGTDAGTELRDGGRRS